MKFSSLLLGLSLIGVTACGGDSGSSKKSATARAVERQEEIGIYRAVLEPMNTSVAGQTAGTVEVVVEGDEVSVEATIAGSPSGVKHLQNIMVGTVCPSASADTNADTVVDMVESMKSTGKILIPLDSNLSEQMMGLDYGPIANGSGAYVYRRSTTLTSLMADLRASDPDTQDLIVKLPFGGDLNLAGRVVMIHGVSTQSSLPESAGVMGDLSREASLPIACGKLVRVEAEGR